MRPLKEFFDATRHDVLAGYDSWRVIMIATLVAFAAAVLNVGIR
ncbi:MAG TPA: hypothetical protein VMT00_05110 [Thermoanaerobaculia bacterium]|nr:hypothetical protein [Thermoanaerobaculia bacterium]